MYNWWGLFSRLANPTKYSEAITSRPLLLSSVGRLIYGSRQKQMTIISRHAQAEQVQVIYRRMAAFFNDLKTAAPQLPP
ncbi:MAG: hypothetical protein GXP08_07570 [Gammaproteobacteria bacterium]|nr:hypothetical protein [Gammaproteobacteria bacterium]